MSIDRPEATRWLVQQLTDELVIGGLVNPSIDLFAAGDRDLNFYTWGGMGLALPLGLGVALAVPHRRVIVLDGDGSLLMNLGALATVGRYRPSNLIHIVWDNAQYEVTGGQATHTAHGTDLVQIAHGCGIAHARRVDVADEFEAAVRDALRAPGPWTIVASCEAAGTSIPERDAAEEALRSRYLNKEAFVRLSGAR